MNIITFTKQGMFMKYITKLFYLCILSLNLYAQTPFTQSLTDGIFSGQITSIYMQQQFENAQDERSYATALGGKLKYETAPFEGFNAGAAFYTSQDIGFATGDASKGEHNSELSSTQGNYTQLAEAYINYSYEAFNIRAGRQVIDTPFADSDPIRMIPNSFEAYIASYKADDFTFMGGKILNWQGYDAGLEKGFIPVGKDGAWFGLAGFANNSFDASLWFYNISDKADIVYTDAGVSTSISDDIALHVSAQYINEQELAQSTINAQIYGALARVDFYRFSILMAYNKALCDKDTSSFSGFGGGALYTSMDTMILDNIATQRNSEAYTTTLLYSYKNFKFLYAFGDFLGEKNNMGEKANIIEQNIGFEYNINNDFQFYAIYAKDSDKIDPNNTQTNWDRIQLNLTYNFQGKKR